MVSILLLMELAARKYPAVRLRQVEKDTAAALGAGKLEYLPRWKSWNTYWGGRVSFLVQLGAFLFQRIGQRLRIQWV